MEMLKKMWSEDDGQGMVEYGLIIGLAVAAVIGLGTILTPAISSVFTTTTTKAVSAASAGN